MGQYVSKCGYFSDQTLALSILKQLVLIIVQNFSVHTIQGEGGYWNLQQRPKFCFYMFSLNKLSQSWVSYLALYNVLMIITTQQEQEHQN